MVVIGGYIGEDIACESPGVYVFNTSSLQWSTSFTSVSGGSKDNPFSQQLSQRGSSKSSGVQGSYGYTVPKPVIAVIGGNPTGGATVTAPVESATSGPLATGKPITYTVTGANGAIITETATASASSSRGGTNVGAAVAGAVAGFFFILASYLAFCALVYRKQLAIYKRHLALAAADPHMPLPDPDRDTSLANAWRRASFMPGRTSGGKASTEGSSRFSSRPSGTYGATPAASSDEDLMSSLEPSYWGVVLNPRRSLRVINR